MCLKFKVSFFDDSFRITFSNEIFFFGRFFRNIFLSKLISIFFFETLLLNVTSSEISKTILFKSELEPNLKFTISAEINSLLKSKNMI